MNDPLEQDVLVFNGLNGASGSYLTDPISLKDMRDRAFQVQKNQINLWESDEHLDDLKARNDFGAAAFDLRQDSDPGDLSDAGWGIIFPESADPAQVAQILEALTDLIDLRKRQAGDRYKLFYGDGEGYRPGETGERFASRHGVQPGAVDPKKMPYYLLIVADPASIPYSFQYQLDIQFATGRIFFQTLQEYANYARSVVTAEQSPQQVSLSRQAVFFGTANEGDKATQLSAEYLIQPLFNYANDDQSAPKSKLGWKAELVPSEQACKDNLLEYMGGAKTPALLFTASHGAGWPYDDARQIPFQGGLVCQDWPGPDWQQELPEDFFVSAKHIPATANMLGSIAFFFACYGAGTPYKDDYAVARDLDRQVLAHRPFIASLPARLLSLPGGGALAVIGHVERAWGYSFKWLKEDAEPDSFKDFLYQTMRGMPVGHAIESLNHRYGQIATQLSEELGELKFNKNRDPYNVSRLWMANNDARAYAIIGDPAVRLPLASKDAGEASRPALPAVTSRPGGVPVVLVMDSLPPEELASVEAEVAAQNLAATTGGQAAGESTPFSNAPVSTPQSQPSKAPDSSEAAGDQPSSPAVKQPAVKPPPVDHVSKEESSPVGFAVPYSSPVDGLAKALQVYAGDEASFGIGDDLKNLVGPVIKNLFQALQDTAQKLQQAASQAATLEITTSVVEDLDNFKPLDPRSGNVKKRFVTTANLTGDVQLYLPREVEDIDETLLSLHKAMVDQAQANRLEMIKALTEMITNLFGSGK